MVDVGANVDCEPEMLQQFGLMGEIYSRLVLKINRPRVGLLSIGEEEHKGNALTRDATPLLKSLGINFIGNVEGRDLFSGHVDVIVCDGFVGNVALKVSEGLSEMIRGMLREALEATVTRKIGYALSRSTHRVQRKWITPSTAARATPGRQRRLHHLSRPFRFQRHQECHSGSGGFCIQQHEPAHRRVARIRDWGEAHASSVATDWSCRKPGRYG